MIATMIYLPRFSRWNSIIMILHVDHRAPTTVNNSLSIAAYGWHMDIVRRNWFEKSLPLCYTPCILLGSLESAWYLLMYFRRSFHHNLLIYIPSLSDTSHSIVILPGPCWQYRWSNFGYGYYLGASWSAYPDSVYHVTRHDLSTDIIANNQSSCLWTK